MRTNWSKQSQRLWDYLTARPWQLLSQPELNKAAAGDGAFVNAFTKRVSECRAKARAEGGDLVLAKDEWSGGQRRTFYRYTPSK